MPTTSLPHAKRERRKDARPGELLDAALALFIKNGYAATRVEEVAMSAGVSKGTLFLYFASKEELFKAVVRHYFTGRFAVWNQRYEAFEGSTPDMLRQALREWWEQAGPTRTPGLTRLMVSEGDHFPELLTFYQQEVIQPGHQLLKRILRRGIERGEFQPMDVNLAVHMLVAPMMFLMLWRHSPDVFVERGIVFDPDQFIALQVETVLRGLQPQT